MIEAVFPLAEVRAALKVKVRDHKRGHSGPIVVALRPHKCLAPTLHFFTAPFCAPAERCRPRP